MNILNPAPVNCFIEGVTTCPHWDLDIMWAHCADVPGQADPLPLPAGPTGHEAVARMAPAWASTACLPARAPPPGVTRATTALAATPISTSSSKDNLLPIPEDLTLEAVAPLELAMCVQVSFDQLAQLDAVKVARFGVTGLGPAGLIALQMARAYGAGEVVAIDPVASRRELALQLGADTAVAPEELGGVLDAAIDCTGLASAVANLMEHTRRAISTFGVLREPVPFGFRQWAGGLALLGYGSHNRSAAERALALVTGGQLRLALPVTHTLPLTRATLKASSLRNKEAIKVLYLPWTE